MYGKQEYERDLAVIEKIEGMVSNNVERKLYHVGLIACFLTHCAYLYIFWRYGIKEMAYFNVFSVAFYFVLVVMVDRVDCKINFIYLSIIEIIVHAALATVCVGCKPDFVMFVLMLIPVGFLMPNKSQGVSFVIMFISLVVYGVLRYFYNDTSSAHYNLDSDIITTVMYFINFAIGTTVLVFVTTIYTIDNHYVQCKLRVQTERLRIMATLDPLTQLSNRRAMNAEMKKMWEESKDSGDTYVMAIGDIDDFKVINDTYGHDYGDMVLMKVAEVIAENVPEHGHVARWGGEEFIFVIPKASLKEGVECADSIIEQISKQTFKKDDATFNVTMSFGVCEGAAGSDLEMNLRCADTRLYKAKNNGKNHTEYTD